MSLGEEWQSGWMYRFRKPAGAKAPRGFKSHLLRNSKRHAMKIFKNGLATGLILQLAIGPVFFFIINLALQKSISDGLAGALAVTIVDYFYITLAILGIGKLLESKKVKEIFGIISSIVLIIFGIFIIKGITNIDISTSQITNSANLLSSFTSVFLLTISNPMTIVFFTSIFTTKALEYSYTKKELLVFGSGTGFATFLFMGASVILFSLIRKSIPVLLVQVLNLLVGCLLIGYGYLRLRKELVWQFRIKWTLYTKRLKAFLDLASRWPRRILRSETKAVF